MAIDAAVSYDIDDRTFTVVPSEAGYQSMLYRREYDQLAAAERRGGYVNTVWAFGAGQQDIASGQPAAGSLQFRFHRGNTAFSRLTGTPRLAAWIILDKQSGQILGVKFHGRPA
jgi:hypothetical protein